MQLFLDFYILIHLLFLSQSHSLYAVSPTLGGFTSNIFHISCISWCLVSDVSILYQHISTPPRRSPSAASYFTLSPRRFAAPTSISVLPRPLLLTCAHAFCIGTTRSAQYFSFTPVSFIFHPPIPLLSSPHLPPPLLFLPLCFVLSGSLSVPKNRFTLHWALWYHLSSPLFWVQALEQMYYIYTANPAGSDCEHFGWMQAGYSKQSMSIFISVIDALIIY